MIDSDPDAANKNDEDGPVEIDQKARRAFLEGAAEKWQRANGRPRIEDELRRILVRYPGDPSV